MDESQQQQETSLVVVAPADAMTVFTTTDEIQKIIAQVSHLAKEAANGLSADTPENRAQLKAVAYKVKRSKTYLDGVGKGLVDELKDLPKRIDAHRKLAREALDRLHEEIRAPLTEWEAEQDRIKREAAEAERAQRESEQRALAALQAIKVAPVDAVGKSSATIKDMIDGMELSPPTQEVFGALFGEAHEEWLNSLDKLRHIYGQAKAIEDQARIDRERQVAEEAARKEREAAEKKILDEKMATERAEQARQQAEAKAAAAEQARIEAEARAAKQAEEAAARAAEQERQRQAAEVERQRIEAEARAADKEHKKRINNEAVNGLITHAGLTVEQARAVVKAVVFQSVPHISITY